MKTSLTPLTGAFALLLASCANDPNIGTANTKEGAVRGGTLGAIAGGVIGHQSGRGLEGAAVGAGLGAAAGGVAGSARDEREARYYNNRY